MGFKECLQREVGHHIPVVTEDGLIVEKKVLDILQPSTRVEEDRFVTENNGGSTPAVDREFFREAFRIVMGVYDEAVDADAQEVVHRVSDQGAAFHLQERFWTALR
jgi:hypothetical protein